MHTYLSVTVPPIGMKQAVANRSANDFENPRHVCRELLAVEANEVSGGYSAIDSFELGLALGTVAGAVSTGTTIGATRGGVIGGALGFSWGFGYGIGTVIYRSWSSRKFF